MIKSKTYKIFSILLSYPTEELKKSVDDMTDILKYDRLLSHQDIKFINNLISFIKNNDLLYLQEYYVSIFDRKKDFSLYIFEHIHGDSRERGMAMVDLKDFYKKSDLSVLTNELPDYLPLFLEYMSLISENEAKSLIGEIVNIIAILSRKLNIINSDYSYLFAIIEKLSDVKCDNNLIDKIILKFDSSSQSDINVDDDWKEPKVF